MIYVPLKCIIFDFENSMKKGYVIKDDYLNKHIKNSYFYSFDDTIRFIKEKVSNKMLHHDRVIFHSRNIPFHVIRILVNIFSSSGYEIYTRSSNSRLKTVIELHDEYEYVPSNFNEKIEKYDSITLVSDLHAVKDKTRAAISIAERRNSFLIFLGDIVDYGGNSVYTVETVCSLLKEGRAELILGNHDRRILKWINAYRKGKKIALNESNNSTVREVELLNDNDKNRFFNIYKTMISLSRTHLFFDNLRLVHACYLPEMEKYKNCRFLPTELEDKALTGFFDTKIMKNRYEWVKNIPKGISVCIGHDVILEPKKKIENSKGGICYMLDMGCGKKGVLQLAHFRKENGIWFPYSWNIL